MDDHDPKATTTSSAPSTTDQQEEGREIPRPQTLPTKVEMGMDWATGMVIIQATVQGAETATVIQLPIQKFIEAAVSLGQQLLMRLNKAHEKGSSGLVIPTPGQVPGDLRRKH